MTALASIVPPSEIQSANRGVCRDNVLLEKASWRIADRAKETPTRKMAINNIKLLATSGPECHGAK
jgi:hypothetical protein